MRKRHKQRTLNRALTELEKVGQALLSCRLTPRRLPTQKEEIQQLKKEKNKKRSRRNGFLTLSRTTSSRKPR